VAFVVTDDLIENR